MGVEERKGTAGRIAVFVYDEGKADRTNGLSSQLGGGEQMSAKRIGGIVCLVFAAMLVVSAVRSLSRDDGPGLGDPSGLGVSRAVGAFLPSVVVLILGLWLFKKPGPSDRP